MPVLRQVAVEMNMPERAAHVRLAPSGEEIPFTQKGTAVRFEIPRVECHQIVEIATE